MSFFLSSKFTTLQLEWKFGLRSTHFRLDTLQQLCDALCAYNVLPEVEVVHSARLRRAYGKFVFPRDQWNGFQPHVRLAPQGHTPATLIHEFAHYADWSKRGKSGHNVIFWGLLDEAIKDFVYERIWGMRKLETVDSLNEAYTRFPATYLSHWEKGIGSGELLKKIIRTIKPTGAKIKLHHNPFDEVV